ncbi:MAG: putative metal-binding motif-containing protein [Sandaracinus sp.]
MRSSRDARAIARRASGLACGLVATLAVACTRTTTTELPDVSFLTNDGGTDANEPFDAGPLPPVVETCEMPGATVGVSCTTPSECQDGCFCNGPEACVAGRCAAGTPPCADGVDCTTDACSEEANRCVHVPDHTQCSDGHACNGYELCDLVDGCTTAAPLVCNDESTCTLDACDDTLGCVFVARDLDDDGFVSSACGGADCDDYDPHILPGVSEICDNRRDDDCNGLRDYLDPACTPTNDRCAQASFLRLGPSGGGASGSTAGLARDYTLSCGGGPDVVFRFSLTTSRDVQIRARSTGTGAPTPTLALRPFDRCAEGPDLACARGNDSILHVRSLPAGTWAIVVATTTETTFELDVALDDPTMLPPVDVCDATTIDVSAGGTFDGDFEDVRDDYDLSCHAASAADAVYRFTIPPGHASDVDIAVSTVTGMARDGAFVALTSDCSAASGELACVTPVASRLRRRALGPGTYYAVIEPLDPLTDGWEATFTFTDPPAARSAGDACSSALDVTPVGSATTGMGSVLATTLEADGGTSCGPSSGARDAYFHFTLGASRDVTLTTTGSGPVSAALTTTCGARASELRCRSGSSPLAQTFRGLGPGEYWIAVDTTASSGSVTAQIALAPPTTAPANDECTGAIALPTPLASRARDTLVGFADDLRGGACTPSGMLDAFYTFTLPSPMSITLDATTVPASTHTIGLTLRDGCGPGADLACDVGVGSAHLATDTLPMGTHTVLVEMRESEASDFSLRFAAFP